MKYWLESQPESDEIIYVALNYWYYLRVCGLLSCNRVIGNSSSKSFKNFWFYEQLYFKGQAGLKGHIFSSGQQDGGECLATASSSGHRHRQTLCHCQLSNSVGFMLIL